MFKNQFDPFIYNQTKVLNPEAKSVKTFRYNTEQSFKYRFWNNLVLL